MSIRVPNLLVDDEIRGQRVIVRAATITGGDIPGLLAALIVGVSIDGVLLALGDRVLVKNQTTQTENGIYVVGIAAAIRDHSLPTGKSANSFNVWVQEGAVNETTAWICNSPNGTDVVDTDPLTWVQFDVADTLSVVRGGTGSITFTTNEFLVGDGTNPITSSGININQIILGSGTDNHVVRWDGTDAIKDSPVILDDGGNYSGVANISMSGDILDANSNELINFTTTPAAVNSVEITNSATGTGPTISSSGDDADVDLNFTTQGTGVFNFSAEDAATPVTIQLQDATGGESVSLTVPTALGASYSLTLPPDDGLAGQVLITDGNGVLTWANIGDAAGVLTSYTYPIFTGQAVASLLSLIAVGFMPWVIADFETPFSTIECVYYHGNVVALQTLTVDIRDIDDNNTWGTDSVVGISGEGTEVFTVTPVGAGRDGNNVALRLSAAVLALGLPQISGAYLRFTV